MMENDQLVGVPITQNNMETIERMAAELDITAQELLANIVDKAAYIHRHELEERYG